MSLIKQIFIKPKKIVFLSKNRYPQCGREYCYCIKTTNLKDKRNRRMYYECYQMWYKYYTM